MQFPGFKQFGLVARETQKLPVQSTFRSWDFPSYSVDFNISRHVFGSKQTGIFSVLFSSFISPNFLCDTRTSLAWLVRSVTYTTMRAISKTKSSP